MRAARALLLAAALGCGGCEASQPSADAGVLARVEDENRYLVALSGPGQLERGAEARLRLAVEPRGPFKLAVEFPLRLDVETGDRKSTMIDEQRQ